MPDIANENNDQALPSVETEAETVSIQHTMIGQESENNSNSVMSNISTKGLKSKVDSLKRVKEDTALRYSEEESEDSADVMLAEQLSSRVDTAPSLLTKERSLGRLQIRSRQAALHSNLSALRLEQLESEVAQLKHLLYADRSTRAYNSDSDRRGKKYIKSLPIYAREIRRSDELQFPISRDSVLTSTKRQPALEVLFRSRRAHIECDTGDCEPSKGQNCPERLRIRSLHLREYLKSISGPFHSFFRTTENKVQGISVHSPLVFLRPFKYFSDQKNVDAVKEGWKRLRIELGKEQKPQPSSAHAAGEDAGVEASQKREIRDREQLFEHLGLLVEFLERDLQPMFTVRQKIRDGTATTIEYEDLWHLFDRGEIAITSSKKEFAFMVVNYAGGRDILSVRNAYDDGKKITPVNGFAVDCISLTSDGESYVPTLTKFTIPRFDGHKPISELPVYPMRFDAREQMLRSSFASNGRRFAEITRSQFTHKRVMGRTIDEPSHMLDAQVIIDMTLAMEAKSEWREKTQTSKDDLTANDARETCQTSWCKHVAIGCCGGDIIFRDLEQDKLDAEEFWRRNHQILQARNMGEPVTETDLMIMQPYVHAFVLRSRQWVTLRVSDLHEVAFENSFDDLVLSRSHQSTVQALVQTHENSHQAGKSSIPHLGVKSKLDLVKGKGTGLIILLHGPPGVGKTSTAECVADSTGRPLYPITCGDLGDTAAEVESALQYSFRLAHKWGCVLLLDEADVFLAKRTKADLRHNAVTSVFLRSLEYYPGILFLTTNRVGAMDPAFISRIQMSLFYPSLDLEVTLELYKKFIARTRKSLESSGNMNFKIKEREILKFAARQYRDQMRECRDTWNGRQIRNAFQTAIALAENESLLRDAEDDEKLVLGKRQFKTVAEGSRKFDEYLNETLGGNPSEIALREKMRASYYHMDTSSQGMPQGKRGRGQRRTTTPYQDTSYYDQADFSSSTDSDVEAIRYEAGENPEMYRERWERNKQGERGKRAQVTDA